MLFVYAGFKVRCYMILYTQPGCYPGTPVYCPMHLEPLLVTVVRDECTSVLHSRLVDDIQLHLDTLFGSKSALEGRLNLFERDDHLFVAFELLGCGCGAKSVSQHKMD